MEQQQYTWRNFLPLIILFSMVLLVALGQQILGSAWSAQGFMATFMGAFFIIFGSFKMYNHRAFVDAFSSYDLIAQRSRTYAEIYPVIELSLGFAYLSGARPVLTNWITLILMLVSAAGVAVALSKKEQMECACLGAVFKIPMTYVTLFEDLLMAAMAAYMLYR
jgi:hypothetical protein